jgi:hypothetical protein
VNYSTAIALAVAPIAIAILGFAFVQAWASPQRKALTAIAATIKPPITVLAIPAWVLPFGFAVHFEAQTRHIPDVLANFLFFTGRFIFPTTYMYKLLPDGVAPMSIRHTFLWDIVFWVVASILFGRATRNFRPLYAFILAPLVVYGIAELYQIVAWQLGYVHHGRPFRVVG